MTNLTPDQEVESSVAIDRFVLECYSGYPDYEPEDALPLPEISIVGAYEMRLVDQGVSLLIHEDMRGETTNSLEVIEIDRDSKGHFHVFTRDDSYYMNALEDLRLNPRTPAERLFFAFWLKEWRLNANY